MYYTISILLEEDTLKYNRLTFVEDLGKQYEGKYKRTFYKWVCDCGNEVTQVASKVRRDIIKSCGCLRNELAGKRARLAGEYAKIKITTHGHTSKGRCRYTYYSWSNLKTRCYNSASQSYKYYGGKGIKVCSRWLNSYENFLEDMGEKPEKGYCIDRIDPKGDYEPSNCQWLSRSENTKRRLSYYKDKELNGK